MTFKTGTGLAAHMRAPRYHPDGTPARAAAAKKTLIQLGKDFFAADKSNGDQPLPQTEGTHMQSALKIIGEKIANTEAELRHLRFQHNHITEALASEYIPF